MRARMGWFVLATADIAVGMVVAARSGWDPLLAAGVILGAVGLLALVGALATSEREHRRAQLQEAASRRNGSRQARRRTARAAGKVMTHLQEPPVAISDAGREFLVFPTEGKVLPVREDQRDISPQERTAILERARRIQQQRRQ